VRRFAPGAPGVLDRIAQDPAPAGLEASRPRRDVLRDVLHDTADGALRRRGAWVRLRHRADGRRSLAVGLPGQPAVHAEIPRGADPFTADTEAGAALRALVEPARLGPDLAIETDRWTRRVRTPAGEARVRCERRTLRAGELRAEVEEVILPRSPAGDAAARALAAAWGLVPRRESPADSSSAALDVAELVRLEQAVRHARRVAVLPMGDGGLALLRRRGRLRVPSAPGAGEAVCREALRSLPGGSAARVRLLGTSPGGAAEEAVEVWVAEGDFPAGEGIARLPLAEALASVGSPALRDRPTLAALHVAARTGLAAEPGSERGETDAAARSALGALPPPGADGGDGVGLVAGTLLNMELSLLAFNRRVMALAADPRVPLLERLRFLAIFGGNLDEFFRVRVAGFQRQLAEGSRKRALDGVTPRQQLDAIGARVRLLVQQAYRLLGDAILPDLGARGIRVLALRDVPEAEREALRARCAAEIRPLLAPLSAGPGHPFPQVRNLRPALVARLRAPGGARRLGIVELPDGVPRFLPLEDGRSFVPLEELVRDVFPALYPGVEVEEPRVFRATRSAELHLDPEGVHDLLNAVEEQVRRRRFRPVVRLEVEAGTPPALRRALLAELRHEAPRRPSPLGEEDVYEVDGPVDLGGLRELVQAAGEAEPDLLYPPAPAPGAPLDAGRPVWEQLREREVLVAFPEDAFADSVERLIVDAADDPDVAVIKLALYRTNPRSRIVEALTRAAAGGKQVFALVELTARFDEIHNIRWARYLRAHGIHVVYGLPGLKVHAKIALVVRREAGGVRRYGYVGTGNLNASTAALYTDLGVLTADAEILDEVNAVFDVLTGAAPGREFRVLMVAPSTMRRRFLELVAREAARGAAGRITAKVNGLADREVISALYAASRAGARIELVVRGICALRPGVPGLSETVRVFSALGRYLEHARIFRFGDGDGAEYWIGSGDWRTRNLSRRIEVAVPVRDPEQGARLDAILARDLGRDDLWELGADGTYYQRPRLPPRPGGGDHPGLPASPR
jgi:polyphosphate kinase